MFLGVVRLIVNHRTFPPSQAHQKCGSFPPPALPGLNGHITLSDSQTGRRPLRATFGGATSTSPGYPPLTQITFSACHAHYPGGPKQVLVGSFPARAAFPVLQAGRHPHRYFRGLLKLHSRYGLHSCSPTIRGLYREAPPAPVSRLGRSQAIKSYQQLLEWVLPPLVICAFGAH